MQVKYPSKKLNNFFLGSIYLFDFQFCISSSGSDARVFVRNCSRSLKVSFCIESCFSKHFASLIISSMRFGYKFSKFSDSLKHEEKLWAVQKLYNSTIHCFATFAVRLCQTLLSLKPTPCEFHNNH